MDSCGEGKDTKAYVCLEGEDTYIPVRFLFKLGTWSSKLLAFDTGTKGLYEPEGAGFSSLLAARERSRGGGGSGICRQIGSVKNLLMPPSNT